MRGVARRLHLDAGEGLGRQIGQQLGQRRDGAAAEGREDVVVGHQ